MRKNEGVFTGVLGRIHGNVSVDNQGPVSPVGIEVGRKGQLKPSGRERKSPLGFRGDKIYYDRTTHK
ncbi:MAG: hypothetical protein A2W22_06575 [Candidatus Levybacteria bacterium RBG_16_35_11]|nr:MAG: hypothetical protein A2W22_06575 [Candidatus Levybacteria bacterium RBG_16_35_11]